MTVFWINPFAFEAGADFESIATVTVGSGGASSIEFTSIPGTYQHLQVRLLGRTTSAVATTNFRTRFNSDTGSNYALHRIDASGASVSAVGYPSLDRMDFDRIAGASATASIFGASVLDILDYATTSKNKTVRGFGGCDTNGGGYLMVESGLWMSTSAITTIYMEPTGGGNWVQYSTAALYGVKA